MKHLLTLTFVLTMLNLLACPTVSISGSNVSCYLGSNGTASITVTGPNAPFRATWSTGEVDIISSSGGSAGIQFLPAGIYTVYVVDKLGCTSMHVVSINEPSPVVGSVTTENVNCRGDATGSVTLSVNGGTPNYSYSWSNGSTSQNISNLLAGNYSVIVRDANNCTSTSISATITEPAQAMTTSIVSSNVSCQTGSDGMIDLSIFGGTTPYVFNWNLGAYSTEDISGVGAGTYNLLVTDAKGCTKTESVTLTEPSAITSTISAVDVNCFNGVDGSINLTPSGGTPPYSFTWSNSTFTMGNTEDLVGVPAESYSVVIQDAKGCTASNSKVVKEPSEILTSITSINVSCYGYSDGEIDLYVIGGSPGYTFEWTNSSSVVGATEDLIGIPSESYSVLITDNHGCTATNSVIIQQPLSPVSLSISTVDVLCFGDNTGEANLTAAGGTLPYVISWSNGSNVEDQIGLFADTYSVTVVDANKCTENTSATIYQPDFPLNTVIVTDAVQCSGGSDGAVNLTTSGGTSPYSFSWVNSTFSLSATSEDLSGLPTDMYVVDILDANNCKLIDTAFVNEPPLLEFSLQPFDVLCYGENTGSIDMTITGGTLPYNFVWSNSEITEDVNNLYAGTYFVSISDANGCSFSSSEVINEPLAPLSAYYNVETPSCYESSDGVINLTVNGGTINYTYSWSTGENVENLYNLSGGAYAYLVTDANGCKLSDSIKIVPPDQISISADITPVSCYQGSDGVIDMSIMGGSAGYSFKWTNADFVLSVGSEDLIDFPADNYIVEVTDSLGCTASASFELQEPKKLTIQMDIENVTCYGLENGSAAAYPTGGNAGGYAYLWSTGDSIGSISDLGPGIFYISVVDPKGCEANDSAIIIQPELIVIDFDMTPVSCRDQSDGIIELNVTGGLGNYSYDWSNRETYPVIDGLLGGEYSVTVTDMVGCEMDTTIEVTVLDVECLEVPTAFTPTGDGYNDTWQLKNIELYPNCLVNVYNKWGKIVFQSTGYPINWDGTFDGRPLPMATYYYIIKLNETIPEYTGPVTIVK